MEYQNWSQPRAEVGADGLPHCVECRGEADLCGYHKKQIRLALGLLRTPGLLQGARDLRYLVASTSSFGGEES